MTERGQRLWPWAALVLLCVFYLTQIGGHPLQDPDEGRYAEIPREMIESGDWVTPRLNYVVYFEKPPLFYWLVALSYQAFGQTEGAARLVSAVSGIATVLLTYWLGLSLVGRRGALLGAAVLGASPLFFVLGQALTIDMLLTACMTGTLACFHRAHAAPAKAGWVLAVSLCAALGVLAKGPVALALPGLIALTFLLLRRDWSTLGALVRPGPVLAFGLVVVPWFWLVSAANPEFLDYFFVREHLRRFASNVGHPEGPLYYVPVVLLGLLPWSAVAIGLACARQGRTSFGEIPRDAKTFLLLWAGIVLGFFTAASSKLATYILPAVPPLALLLGSWLDRVAERAELTTTVVRALGTLMFVLGAVAFTVGVVGLPFEVALGQAFGGDPEDVRDIAYATIASGLGFAVPGFVVGRSALGARLSTATALLVLILGVGLGIFGALPGRAMVKTSQALAAAAAPEMREGDLLVLYKKLWQGLPFYAEQRISMIKNYDEIKHMVPITPDRERYYWKDLKPLVREWDSGRRVFLFTNRELVPEVAAVVETKPRVLARDRRRVVVVNFPPGDGEASAPGLPPHLGSEAKPGGG